MRTTLDIADDVLQAAKELARQQKKTTGQAISDLVRAAMTHAAETEATTPVLGFRPFGSRGQIVTDELVDRLRDEGPY